MSELLRVDMEIVIYTPPSNEPWHSPFTRISHITKYYEDGFDTFMPGFFGMEASEGFYDEIPKDCPVNFTHVRKCTVRHDYYAVKGSGSFKSACFNRTKDNPYQLPKWTLL